MRLRLPRSRLQRASERAVRGNMFYSCPLLRMCLLGSARGSFSTQEYLQWAGWSWTTTWYLQSGLSILRYLFLESTLDILLLVLICGLSTMILLRKLSRSFCLRKLVSGGTCSMQNLAGLLLSTHFSQQEISNCSIHRHRIDHNTYYYLSLPTDLSMQSGSLGLAWMAVGILPRSLLRRPPPHRARRRVQHLPGCPRHHAAAPLLWNLKMARKEKFGIFVMFSLGIFITITSCIRLQYISRSGLSVNPTWDYTETIVWTGIELSVSIIVVCLPAMRKLTKRFIPWLASTISSGSYVKETTTGSSSTRARKDFQQIRDNRYYRSHDRGHVGESQVELGEGIELETRGGQIEGFRAAMTRNSGSDEHLDGIMVTKTVSAVSGRGDGPF
uniref:Rhodopsin domain-containing protein n=1 Tax=Bionectria ochroleuca TaxID=29856 RepID=A0A8H7NCA9_BIOOC